MISCYPIPIIINSFCLSNFNELEQGVLLLSEAVEGGIAPNKIDQREGKNQKVMLI